MSQVTLTFGRRLSRHTGAIKTFTSQLTEQSFTYDSYRQKDIMEGEGREEGGGRGGEEEENSNINKLTVLMSQVVYGKKKDELLLLHRQ